MAVLEKRGYITRTQSRITGGIYGTTMVEMVMLPAHLKDQIEEASVKKAVSSMYAGTIYALGFGLMPKLVARDIRLHYKARGIYGYLAVYSDAAGDAYPSREKILRDLKITKDTFAKYMRELIDYGYVSAKQLRDESGKMSRTVYTLNAFPEEIVKQREDEKAIVNQNAPLPIQETLPYPKKPTTVKSEEIPPCPKKPTTVEVPCPNLPGTAEPCPEKPTTAIYNNNYHISTNTICSLQDRLIDSLREKIHYNILLFVYEKDPMAMEALTILVEAMAKILTTKNPRVQLGNEILDTRAVCEVLLRVNNPATIAVIDRYLARTDTVRNPGSYLLKSIYLELLQPSTETEDDVLEIF